MSCCICGFKLIVIFYKVAIVRKCYFLMFCLCAAVLPASLADNKDRIGNRISVENARLIRGGTKTDFWNHYFDRYCVKIIDCQTDGCGGPWPNSNCTSHEAIVKLDVPDEECTSGSGSNGWQCIESIARQTCSVLQGTCIVVALNTQPPASICAQIAASGSYDSPEKCESLGP